ncbi:hypothetical protein JR316_0002926 [Psilocybe cubensis]|uniref:Uncharacterized protein n=2 Tax=Psilocybe cubensis TaxID=181762 RepID=A0ACB8H6A5_PSICU|nr:hypothetical protein JR316_0002926 [Psilocybe cubensis]KAH9483458.1 hypothetical protein JR316_0002926 [Psilocybe cubensis]
MPVTGAVYKYGPSTPNHRRQTSETMPGGLRNPLSLSQMVEKIGSAVHDAKDGAHNKKESLQKKMAEHGLMVPYVDLQIQFIGASGLPKMDVVGTADPYFIANLDDKITFVSTVKQNILSPVWNEVWRVKNVPAIADLEIKVMDKDEGSMTDGYIGKAKTSVNAGARELEITGPLLRRSRGTIWVKIESTPSSDEQPFQYPYLFDGPIRFSRHYSPTVGKLTNLEGDARLYSTWKMYLKGIPLFFGDVYQPWNKSYKAAQSIFQGPTSVAVRSGIQAGHRMLYARTASNGFGVIESAADVLQLLHGGASRPGSNAPAHPSRVKPAVYTYIISSEDDSFRFSETGAAFFVDFASKHALHSNCAEKVRYSGEFHPRPQGGWACFSDDVPDDQVHWELVIDNNSGTYAPDKTMLPALQKLLEYNFPGFGIFALDHGDEELKKSREACRDYALRFRGVRQEELQPHAQQGEETLSHHASVCLSHAEKTVEHAFGGKS